MPIYEYACSACGKEFEKLVRQSSPAPACPDCHSSDLHKKLSTLPPSPVRLHERPTCLAPAKVAATLMVRAPVTTTETPGLTFAQNS